MSTRRMRRLQTVLVSALALLLQACGDPSPESAPEEGLSVSRAMSGSDQGFTQALHPREFTFPKDHGPHPGYQHEWWYFTGNLKDTEGRRFGYQVTFFRIGLRAKRSERPSAWAMQGLWMAHVAVSDLDAAQHLAHERFTRDALGLAGALGDGRGIWVEDWRIEHDLDRDLWRIDIGTPDFRLDFSLREIRPPVLQGDAGLSAKSSESGNASYYYSIPRLETRGSLQLAGKTHELQGLSWLDREWSTSALGPEQAGWDWFSLQLEDGTDLMYYRLRLKNGDTDRHSRGSLQSAGGLHIDLRPENTRLTPLHWWQDGDGHRYPIAWRIHIVPLQRTLTVRAAIPDQLMDLSVRYWEGAVEVREQDRPAVIGRGYLEMTGYPAKGQ